MRLPFTKTVDGTTYTLTDEPSQADDHLFLWRAFDGSGKVMEPTDDEVKLYSRD